MIGAGAEDSLVARLGLVGSQYQCRVVGHLDSVVGGGARRQRKRDRVIYSSNLSKGAHCTVLYCTVLYFTKA